MVYFRTDGNKEIGSGHVMRTIAIAKEFKKSGEECKFIKADDELNLLIKSNGFGSICLNSIWNDLNKEIDSFTELLSKKKPSVLFIDSYFVTRQYLEAISQCTKLIYIDDLQNYVECCDIIVNYMIMCVPQEYKKLYYGTKTKLLLGTEYTPLREEFHNVVPIEAKPKVENVLVTTGGTDEYNIAGRMLEYICKDSKFSDIVFHVVVGVLNRNKKYLINLLNTFNNVKLCISPPRMSELMLKSDVAISAGGTTLHELCACGVPTICFAFADNQLACTETFAKKGIMLFAGDFRTSAESFFKNIENNLLKLINDHGLRRKLSEASRVLVDGNGSKKIAKAILQLTQ